MNVAKRKRLSLSDTRYKSIKTWLRAVIKRLIQAEIEDTWKGSYDPETIPAVEAELADARAELKDVLAYVDDTVDRDIRARFPTGGIP